MLELNWLRALFLSIFLVVSYIFAASLTLENSSIDRVVSAEDAYLEHRGITDVATSESTTNCRYGTVAWPSQLHWLGELGAGWFHDFAVRHRDPSNGAEYFPTVRIRQDKLPDGYRLASYSATPPLTDDVGGLGWWIRQLPNATWIIGNEPDRGPDPGQTVGFQDDTMPDLYAKAYHDIYHFIKERDPSALVANAGLVQATPGRLQYLDIAWEAYRSKYGASMPVDVWNMHIYILPEAMPNGEPNGIANIALGTDPGLAIRSSGGQASQCPRSDIYCYAEHDSVSIFAEQIRAIREWMWIHGQRDKPLILSEHSLLYPYQQDIDSCYLQDEFGNCFDPPRVTAFLENVFEYLETAKDSTLGFPADDNRLVQQWNWYSVEVTGPGDISNLVDGSEVTMVGAAYRNWITNQPTYINLRPDAPLPKVVTIPPGSTVTSTTLGVSVRNNGTVGPSEPFTVTFFSDSELTQIIGSEMVPAPNTDFLGITGCATRHVHLSVKWGNLGPGVHDFWVLVDSENNISEYPADKQDNLARGLVLVEPEQILLPVVLK